MAKIDDLLNHVSDVKLRDRLRSAVSEIRDRQRFGLVFEQHIPETVVLARFRIRRGAFVTRRDLVSDEEWVVDQVTKDKASLRNVRTGATAVACVSELIV